MSKLTKADSVKRISELSGVSQKDIKLVLHALPFFADELVESGDDASLGKLQIKSKVSKAKTGQVAGMEYFTPEYTYPELSFTKSVRDGYKEKASQ